MKIEKLKTMKHLKKMAIVTLVTGLFQIAFPQTFTKISDISSAGGFTQYQSGIAIWYVGQLSGNLVKGPTTQLGSGMLFALVSPTTATAVSDVDDLMPKEFSLSQNYPNPFNPSTTIAYELPKHSIVTIAVFNVLGQLISTLVNEEKNAGRHRVIWNGRALGGIQASSGVYFYRIYARPVEDVTDFTATRKLILLK